MADDIKPLALRASTDFSDLVREIEAQVASPRTMVEFFLNKEHARALAALLREAGEGWLPIESAPRDGTWFLAANDEVVDRCFFTTTDYCDPGWYFAFACFPLDCGGDERPTHWRPLPAPPATGGKDD